MTKETIEFYNSFSGRQQHSGIHHRHLSIQRFLEKFGLQRESSVLEIGCGIGTQSQLILEYLNSKGKLHAIDISDESIKVAKNQLGKYSNARFLADDITETYIDDTFDVILLPDVLEHIPLEHHPKLFKKLSKLLKKDGFILIHIPDPKYLEWVTINKPHQLQIIDSPIHTDKLLRNAYDADLIVTYLESYSIFMFPADYQIIILKKNHSNDYTVIKRPKNDHLWRRVKRKLKRISHL